MGMAAGQARLLSITARLSDNENTGQSVSYVKQRLADQTEQINAEYNEALSMTKLSVLTGFVGAEAKYTDISYNLMTSPQMAENTKQYIITDTTGKVMVQEKIADAYASSKGDYNKFLATLGYSQADIAFKHNDTTKTDDQHKVVGEKIHQAWDKYFESVGIKVDDNEHSPEYSFTTTFLTDANGKYLDANGNVTNNPQVNGTTAVGYGYAGYLKQTDNIQSKDADGNLKFDAAGKPIYDKTTIEYRPKYDKDGDGNPTEVQLKDKDGNPIFEAVTVPERMVQVGEVVYKTNDDGQIIQSKDAEGKLIYHESSTDGVYYELKGGAATKVYEPINYEGNTPQQRELYEYALSLTEAYLRDDYNIADYKTASNSDNTSVLTYYKNLYTKMSAAGCFAYTNDPAKGNDGTGLYKYTQEKDKSGTPEQDNTIFEKMLKSGELRLEYYNTTQKKFISTSLSDDQSIQEVKDEKKIAAAESKYTQDLSSLENKDKKLDLELKKLDTEHSALQTEYDSVKSVVDKNVEKSFSIFS